MVVLKVCPCARITVIGSCTDLLQALQWQISAHKKFGGSQLDTLTKAFVYSNGANMPRMDADDTLYPTCVSTVLICLDKHHDCDTAVGQCLTISVENVAINEISKPISLRCDHQEQ